VVYSVRKYGLRKGRHGPWIQGGIQRGGVKKKGKGPGGGPNMRRKPGLRKQSRIASKGDPHRREGIPRKNVDFTIEFYGLRLEKASTR